MQLIKQTRIYYGLLNKAANSLLTISKTSNEGGEFCGSHTVTFETDAYYPEYLVDEPEIAVRAKMFDTPWYNSSEEYPGHGSVYMGQCQIVKVTKEVLIEAIEHPQPKTYTRPRVLLNCFDLSDPFKFENKGKSKNKYMGLLIDGKLQDRNYVQPGDLFVAGAYEPFKEVVAVVDAPEHLLKDHPEAFVIVLERTRLS